jgi:hypothetical protein
MEAASEVFEADFFRFIKARALLITTLFWQSFKVLFWPKAAAGRGFLTKCFFGSSGF